MPRTRLLLAALIATTILSAPTLAAAQTTSQALTIAGDVATPLSVTPEQLKGFPRTKVEVKEDGRTLVYEGVLVGEILKRAGAPLGTELRGNAIASYVVASATDGYQVVFSLAELDPGFTSKDIIVTDTMNSKQLFAYQGPLPSSPRRTPGRHGRFGCCSVSDVVRLKK